MSRRRPDVDRMADGVVRLWTALQRRKDERVSTAELTTSQALALRAVVLEGPLRMGSLAEHLGVTVATASRTVDALAERGFLRREADPADARAVRVVATPSGRREHRLRRERFVRALARLSEELSEVERRQLAESLDTLARLFGEPERGRRASRAV
ncbi:MAG TPA: MarR family transcriptional regulator [Gaiellaceae bacterium]|nr:MarR family transcriptional regulator [Gaiellaceae bacterium]